MTKVCKIIMMVIIFVVMIMAMIRVMMINTSLRECYKGVAMIPYGN
jgi:hypothetical protein